MQLGPYDIPRTLLLGAVVLAALVVGLVLWQPFSSSNSRNSQPETQTAISGKQAVSGLSGDHLVVTLKPGRQLKGYAVFVTLSRKGGQLIGTQRLVVGQPLGLALKSGDYSAAVIFSPCHGSCSIFHGGIVLAPVSFSGGHDVKLTLTPVCRNVKYKPGVDCSSSRLVLN
jgi:hypothetical protein